MKSTRRNNKSKHLNPEIEKCFNSYFTEVNKIVPLTTMADWPSHKELDLSIVESGKALKQLSQSLNEIIQSVKPETVKRNLRIKKEATRRS